MMVSPGISPFTALLRVFFATRGYALSYFIRLFQSYHLCCEAAHFIQQVVHYQQRVFVAADVQHFPQLIEGCGLGAHQCECVHFLAAPQHFFQLPMQLVHVFFEQVLVLIAGVEILQHFLADLLEGSHTLVADTNSYAAFFSHRFTDCEAALYFATKRGSPM